MNREKKVINVSYWFGKEYQKKGYARESVLKLGKTIFDGLKDWGLDISFKCENKSSEKLANYLAQYLLEDNENSHKDGNGNFTNLKVKWDKYQSYIFDFKEYVISKVPQVA